MRRWLLILVLACMIAPSCTPEFAPPSQILGLRIMSITPDKSYALPGDEITLRMTVYDGLDPDNGARPLQIVWIAGCFNPVGDQYFLCFEQLLDVLAPLASGAELPEGLVKIDQGIPASSGSPNAHEFTFKLPDDIVSGRPVPDTGPHYGIAYVFFAACAGTLAPAPLVSLGGAVPEFPLQCLDDEGNPLGADSFVPGYTQVYSFADSRANLNPEVTSLTLDDQDLPEDISNITEVEACPLSDEERREMSCQREQPIDACTKYKVEAVIADVAEFDPDSTDADGTPLRETVWVNYFADGGSFDRDVALVSDAKSGYIEEHGTEWVPPDAPSGSIVNLWAVARDQRGGSSVVRRFVRIR